MLELKDKRAFVVLYSRCTKISKKVDQGVLGIMYFSWISGALSSTAPSTRRGVHFFQLISLSPGSTYPLKELATTSYWRHRLAEGPYCVLDVAFLLITWLLPEYRNIIHVRCLNWTVIWNRSVKAFFSIAA